MGISDGTHGEEPGKRNTENQSKHNNGPLVSQGNGSLMSNHDVGLIK